MSRLRLVLLVGVPSVLASVLALVWFSRHKKKSDSLTMKDKSIENVIFVNNLEEDNANLKITSIQNNTPLSENSTQKTTSLVKNSFIQKDMSTLKNTTLLKHDSVSGDETCVNHQPVVNITRESVDSQELGDQLATPPLHSPDSGVAADSIGDSGSNCDTSHMADVSTEEICQVLSSVSAELCQTAMAPFTGKTIVSGGGEGGSNISVKNG